jgi:hypothetical protein
MIQSHGAKWNELYIIFTAKLKNKIAQKYLFEFAKQVAD